ncbi:Paxillin [Pleurostoma richardsiae]|uniref:Paxillin n=1 Tax=Pleurostoma richardsiae TaxID=41990 RepID=A0AA38RU35_9PEZI|nr:Paxillin [Pleurostoma richardsiae]
MVLRGKSKERSSTRKVTPPSPSYMSSEQFAAYLAELRESRLKRPGGARPQPPSETRRDSVRTSATSNRTSLGSATAGRPSFASTARTSLDAPMSETSSLHQRAQSDAPQLAGRPSISASVSSRYSTISGHGRDYYPERPIAPLKPGEVVPTATYIERGQRWMEKEEAFSLRQAMEDLDLKNNPPDEEERIYQAALDEASELVWQHQHGVKPPEPGAPYSYKAHLRKNSYAHARTASAGYYGDDVVPTGLARDCGSRSVSGSSSSSDGFGTQRSRRSYGTLVGGAEIRRSLDQADEAAQPARPRPAKPYNGLTNSAVVTHSGRRRSSMKRNISGEVERPFSGAQIYEEPEGSPSPARSSSPEKSDSSQPLRNKPKNPLNRVQFASEVPASADSPVLPPKLHKYEIHRNPPTQSRNAQYTTNSSTPEPVEHEEVPKKNGIELRSDDIRQATSMRLKDRSPKLPTPSAVSDRPGRPIVSFDKNWKAPEEATDEKPDRASQGGRFGASRGRQDHQTPPIPAIAVTEAHQQAASSPSRDVPPPPSIQVDAPTGGPPIPTIAVPDGSPSIPTIVVPDEPNTSPDIPIIVTPDDGSAAPASRPLPTPQKGRPAVRPRGHWSPAPPAAAGNRATARCHECNYPIEGRFVALAGCQERFHPQCFRCYTCGTALEALEISPEPDHHRAARLERIRRRAAGEALEEKPGETMAEDGDERLRFYCHLDWHELFAPRCKHCTTPILGEHVVALGHHWHYGHFFCAECGDPFERGMTHIEKDGYAWCVACQTKRTERRAPKCRRCRGAVIGQYVRALGGEWHDECFRCATCHGGFDDGQVFPREGAAAGETVVLCTKCRERELKV